MKEYTVGDMVTLHNQRKRKKVKIREYNLILEAAEKTRKLKTKPYFFASKKKQKQMRAEANTIPLGAWER